MDMPWLNLYIIIIIIISGDGGELRVGLAA